MTHLVHYKDETTLMATLAAVVAGQLAEALQTRGKATLAVPGGTTPGPFLRALAQADIDWASVNVMLTDERFVAGDSPRSNTRLLRETLLQGPAAAASLVPLYASAGQPEQVLTELGKGIASVLPIDVCVLGMGADLHTASLFPGADRLAEALDPNSPAVLLPMRAPGAPEPRLTLTAGVLRASRHLHLLITGQDKLAALRKAEQPGPAADAPVRAILSVPSLSIHYAEKAVAT